MFSLHSIIRYFKFVYVYYNLIIIYIYYYLYYYFNFDFKYSFNKIFFFSRPATNKKRTKNLLFEPQKHEDNVPDLKPGTSRIVEEPNENGVVKTVIKIEEDEDNPTSIVPISQQPKMSLLENQNDNEVVKIEENEPPQSVEKESPEVPSLTVDFTEKIGIENKVDLYKAVFLSSSESEDEEEENGNSSQEEKKMEEFKKSILSESLIPQIKPIKQGILSGINFKEFNMNRNRIHNEEKNENEEEPPKEVVLKPDPLLYGPQIPVGNGDGKIIQNTPHKIVISSDSEDEWVEKDAIKKKKSKHKKKDKKQKHKKHKKKDRR